jgi:hypothetical protein
MRCGLNSMQEEGKHDYRISRPGRAVARCGAHRIKDDAADRAPGLSTARGRGRRADRFVERWQKLDQASLRQYQPGDVAGYKATRSAMGELAKSLERDPQTGIHPCQPQEGAHSAPNPDEEVAAWFYCGPLDYLFAGPESLAVRVTGCHPLTILFSAVSALQPSGDYL